MQPSYRTPQELVEALHARQSHARTVLFDLLREPIRTLMGALLRRHDLPDEPDLLVRHGMHHAETYLRFRPTHAVAGLSWSAFRASLLLRVAKLTVQPHGSPGNGLDGPSALPQSRQVQFETFFRPFTRLGNQFFGGDWYAGRRHDDGSVWVCLADVTGHGLYAYLLASALPAIWQRCWQAHPGWSPEPAEVLSAIHHLLGDCLPDGIFLECLLARVDLEGKVTLSPAGGARILVRQGTRPPGLVQLRGSWLGLSPPTCADQRYLHLGAGDELLLTTDGVFDQLDDEGGAEAIVGRVAVRRGSMFRLFRDDLERSLAQGPQKDDITMVLLRFQDSSDGADEAEAPITLPFRGGQSPAGRGDVPV